MFEQADTVEAARAIQQRAPGIAPVAAVVLGSGLAGVAASMADTVAIDYDDLPGFPVPVVDGHPGRLVLGTLGGLPTACLVGRVHAYEGDGLAAMRTPIRAARLLGCELIHLTCAAGAVDPDLAPGRLMAVRDHLNLMGGDPLVGRNEPEVGPRFPEMTRAYDPDLLALQRDVAAESGVDLAEGVYAGMLGPSFETTAEVRMLRVLGADAVGMSLVPECILARHCGLRVSATAVITNAAGAATRFADGHARTLAASDTAAGALAGLVAGCLSRLAADRDAC